jgi:hypothetical protein
MPPGSRGIGPGVGAAARGPGAAGGDAGAREAGATDAAAATGAATDAACGAAVVCGAGRGASPGCRDAVGAGREAPIEGARGGADAIGRVDGAGTATCGRAPASRRPEAGRAPGGIGGPGRFGSLIVSSPGSCDDFHAEGSPTTQLRLRRAGRRHATRGP